MEDKTALRARDFWTSLVLIAACVFFLWCTTDIPLFDTQTGGVTSGDWYNSAAVVPYGIFGLMLLCALGLLTISIKDGGAERALRGAGVGWERAELIRMGCIAIILFFYIFALVPRVDFVICSALLITSMIYGFHDGHPERTKRAAAIVAAAGLYAFVMNFPQSEWAKPHDDDWVTLALWLGLTIYTLINHRDEYAVRIAPVMAILVPLILVLAMAFGFRQNVPNRSGLLFSQIEYHYYVTLKPLWAKKK
ncbi:tripartite tricarboxylate transporter TctB family protein [Aliiruegeria lutimaris]|uniref:Tripartite tricarboxylate transporter TctB family protein n=1 Tax=Aliiruegeria lutimaris TaxID=571298 RepID=A0A1G8JZF0_9RHOB|nr:tripartite tricarboxylate transporter TctB family protein [Aliiruegeria lutimaris]SDI36487.1 Tripartite tricarboxylate transporter TctB family protein [Aliiruegeria lutimaris]